MSINRRCWKCEIPVFRTTWLINVFSINKRIVDRFWHSKRCVQVHLPTSLLRRITSPSQDRLPNTFESPVRKTGNSTLKGSCLKGAYVLLQPVTVRMRLCPAWLIMICRDQGASRPCPLGAVQPWRALILQIWYRQAGKASLRLKFRPFPDTFFAYCLSNWSGVTSARNYKRISNWMRLSRNKG